MMFMKIIILDVLILNSIILYAYSMSMFDRGLSVGLVASGLIPCALADPRTLPMSASFNSEIMPNEQYLRVSIGL
jgi:hypothetical protein